MIAGPVFGRFGDSEIRGFLTALRPDAGVARLAGAASVSAPVSASASAPASASAAVSADDAFAAGLWSCLVEPGDAVGGALRGVLGPAAALEVLAEPDQAVVARLAAAGLDDAARLDIAAARKRWAPRHSEARFRSALKGAITLGARLVVPGDPEWPPGFDELGLHAPVALWVRGDPAAPTALPGVAVVGCRAATAYGEQVAAELANSLATRGVAVFSGGAYGIDGMAHRASLASGGSTVAVLAGGVDRFYPSGHHELLSRVASDGAVVSENPCGTSPSRWRFLQRNRLLAAMSAATVVVEAGARSGALNTAGHAQALARPLGAIPGPITSRASDGCHRLLREGVAECVTGVDDVLALIRPALLSRGEAAEGPSSAQGPRPAQGPPRALSLPPARGASSDEPRSGGDRPPSDELRVLDALSRRRPKRDDDIAVHSGLGVGRVRGVLAVLELSGRAQEVGGGWVPL